MFSGLVFALLAELMAIHRRPRTGSPAQVHPQKHGLMQRLVAVTLQMDLMDFSGLVTSARSRPEIKSW